MKTSPSLALVLGLANMLQVGWAADESNAPVTTNPALAGDGVQIGVARQDGVTVSADGASVTRNGITEKLSKELYLPSGVVVRPNGSVTLADKTETTLRVTQILTFDGKIVPLTVSPNVNPGDPRGNGGDPVSTRGTVQRSPSNANMAGFAGAPDGSNGSLRRDSGAGTGSVFLGSDGVPFMGSLNPDGTLLRSDGVLLPADGSFRAVTFGQDGTPTLGTVNSNGSITRADGSVISADGSVRSANGTLLSPANQNISASQPANNQNAAGSNISSNPSNPGNLGTANNGNSNPGVPQVNGNVPVQTNNGVTAGRNTNSPNNSGTLNRGTNANGQSPNNTGTVNNPGNQNPSGNAQGSQGAGQTGASGAATRSGNNAGGGARGGSGGGANNGGAAGGSGGGGAPR
jgi:hypothetical protein